MCRLRHSSACKVLSVQAVYDLPYTNNQVEILNYRVISPGRTWCDVAADADWLSEAALGGRYGLKLPECRLQFKRNKFIVSFITMFGALSFPGGAM